MDQIYATTHRRPENEKKMQATMKAVFKVQCVWKIVEEVFEQPETIKELTINEFKELRKKCEKDSEEDVVVSPKVDDLTEVVEADSVVEVTRRMRGSTKLAK
ncbi:unnamed protein product [Sphenostylis stenocarpa]|uniref:Uncharacterized protein n=1 Tax=Sphenostylis stenocarpa TaxID=92480 RepID=A0AA86T4K5_9FABA|nr:unnamed protein product [Sphenostylis stenocarpa]